MASFSAIIPTDGSTLPITPSNITTEPGSATAVNIASSALQAQESKMNGNTLSVTPSELIEGSKNETTSDTSDEEESEEEAIERECDELKTAAKDACHFIEHDDRNGKIRCMCVSGDTCGTGQSVWRKVISDFFGRNKKNAQQIPDLYQVIWCRKHYQRGAYQNHKPTVEAESGKLASLGKITWIVVQLLLIEKWRPNAIYSIDFSEKEKKRLKAANGGRPAPPKAPRGQGKTGRLNHKSNKDAPIEVLRANEKYLGHGKTLKDCLRVVNEMKYDVEDGDTVYLPGIEFLLEVDENFEMPRKIKRTQTPSKKDGPSGGQGPSNGDDRDGDDYENREGDDDDAAGDSYEGPTDTPMTDPVGTPDMEADEYDGTSIQSTPPPTDCENGQTSYGEGPSRSNGKPHCIANGKEHVYSHTDGTYTMHSRGFTAVNAADGHPIDYSSSYVEDKQGPDKAQYPPDHPRNPIRQEVMHMRAELLAQQALGVSPLSTEASHSYPYGLGRSDGITTIPMVHDARRSTSVSSSEHSPKAFHDLLKLRRSGKPIDPQSTEHGFANLYSTVTRPTLGAREQLNRLTPEILSDTEANAVNGLLSLKGERGVSPHQLERPSSMADFRPHITDDSKILGQSAIRSTLQCSKSSAVAVNDTATNAVCLAVKSAPSSNKRRRAMDDDASEEAPYSCKQRVVSPAGRKRTPLTIIQDERSLRWE
ncbi:MAG: hypothetical protein M1822_000376 [Bathelium mastoideum]|nr:MAG: hypothetical protein M1822_000376 [Bathelium mastoideum]